MKAAKSFLNFIRFILFGNIFLFNLWAVGLQSLSYTSSSPVDGTVINEQQNLKQNDEVQNPIDNPIAGAWRFVGHIYNDTIIPPMNDKLVITFEFLPDNTDILKWYRIGETGFCERKAKYNYIEQTLSEEIFWVNPENSFECSKDPDMHLGRKTSSVLKKINGQLHLELPLGDQKLVYLWDPIR